MDDFELLDAWRAGDRAAASALFARHFTDVFAFFRSKLEHVAEDLTQQTFLNCVESRDRFRGVTTFRIYLFIVARNCLYSYVRKKANRDHDPDFALTSLVALDPSLSGALIFREQNRLLVHALRRLPIELQIAIELYYVQRLQAAEIAEVLGIPVGTVRSRIRRAIEQLRVNLELLTSDSAPVRTTLTDLRRWAHELRHGAAT